MSNVTLKPQTKVVIDTKWKLEEFERLCFASDDIGTFKNSWWVAVNWAIIDESGKPRYSASREEFVNCPYPLIEIEEPQHISAPDKVTRILPQAESKAPLFINLADVTGNCKGTLSLSSGSKFHFEAIFLEDKRDHPRLRILTGSSDGYLEFRNGPNCVFISRRVIAMTIAWRDLMEIQGQYMAMCENVDRAEFVKDAYKHLHSQTHALTTDPELLGMLYDWMTKNDMLK